MNDFYWESSTEDPSYDVDCGTVTSTVSLDQYIQDADGVVSIIQAFGLTTEDLVEAIRQAGRAAEESEQSKYSKSLCLMNEESGIKIELVESDQVLVYSSNVGKEWWPHETFSPEGKLASWQAALAVLAVLAMLAAAVANGL